MASGLPKALARGSGPDCESGASRVTAVSPVRNCAVFACCPMTGWLSCTSASIPACSPLADEAADRAIDRLVGVSDRRDRGPAACRQHDPAQRVDLLLRIVAA
jgi:hypothetical protein